MKIYSILKWKFIKVSVKLPDEFPNRFCGSLPAKNIEALLIPTRDDLN